jgi:hypothetical protein
MIGMIGVSGAIVVLAGAVLILAGSLASTATDASRWRLIGLGYLFCIAGLIAWVFAIFKSISISP